jgi:murein DD-endopeptidase MepM/ murein hydrolase activator NlpD
MMPPRAGVIRAALLLSAMLVACGPRTQPPAPVVSGTGTHPGIAVAPSGGSTAPALPAAGQVTVQPGETLYAVSRRANVPVRTLIEANRLEPPYDVAPGRRLALPAVPQHTVEPGETLYGISRLYGVDTSTLARSNQLAPPYAVSAGQVLTLPAPVQGAGRRGPAPVIQATAPAGWALAAPPSPTPPAYMPRPAIEPPPAAAPTPPAIAKPVAPPVLEPPRVVERTAPPPPVAASPPPPAAQPAPPEQLAALPPPPLPRPPKQGEARFLWPVHGRILATYGTGGNGTHNDGINIAAPAGTPVLAADAGVVAYAGNELRGYGNLLLVKHSGGWMTAYAHNSALLVKRGDRVKRGQEIARVGATGAVGEPQLHFEIRQGTRALDPDDYLPPLAATAARG